MSGNLYFCQTSYNLGWLTATYSLRSIILDAGWHDNHHAFLVCNMAAGPAISDSRCRQTSNFPFDINPIPFCDTSVSRSWLFPVHHWLGLPREYNRTTLVDREATDMVQRWQEIARRTRIACPSTSLTCQEEKELDDCPIDWSMKVLTTLNLTPVFKTDIIGLVFFRRAHYLKLGQE